MDVARILRWITDDEPDDHRAEELVGVGTDLGEEAFAAWSDDGAKDVEVCACESREDLFGLAQDVCLTRWSHVDGRGDERAFCRPATIDGGLGDAGALRDDID